MLIAENCIFEIEMDNCAENVIHETGKKMLEVRIFKIITNL